MKLKSNAPLLLSSLSCFHNILHCLIIAPCGPASLQSCHRLRSFVNLLVHFHYPILLVFSSFAFLVCSALSNQFYFHALLIFYSMELWHHLWSPLSSHRLCLVSCGLASTRLLSSRLVSSLVFSRRIVSQVISRCLPPFRLPWYQPIASHLGFSRLCSSRLVFRHT